MTRPDSTLLSDEIRSSSSDDGLPINHTNNSGRPLFEERWSPPNNWFLHIHPNAATVRVEPHHRLRTVLLLAAAAAIFGILVWRSTFAAPQQAPLASAASSISAAARPVKRLSLLEKSGADEAARDSALSSSDRRTKVKDESKALLMLFFQSLRQGRGSL